MSRADASRAIFKANEAMIDAADAIIANLTPFRGAGADPGTVYELGYAAGRGKLCLGYSNDPAIYAERVRRLADGAVLTFRPATDLLGHVARVLDAERVCCRFLHFALDVPPNDSSIELSA